MMELQPQLITIIFQDTYEQIKAAYPHQTHLEASRRKYSLYGIGGRNGDQRAPISPTLIPPVLHAALETAQIKEESSDCRYVPSLSPEAWKGVEAREWENFVFRVAHFRISAPQFIEQVGNYMDRQKNVEVNIFDKMDMKILSAGTLDLMVIAFMESKVHHMEPVFEHTLEGTWRAYSVRPSCF